MSKKSNKEHQAAFRKKRGIAKTVTIHLNEEQAALYERCFLAQIQTSSKTDFALSSFLTGLKFRANSGNTKKQK